MVQFLCGHPCSDTLCHLRCAILNQGPTTAWEHLPDFVPEVNVFAQSPQCVRKYDTFMIHEIFRTSGTTNPANFMVVVGRAAVPLGSLAATKVGSALLRDLFTTPNFPPLEQQAIDSSIKAWGLQSIVADLYEVFPSDKGRRIRWNNKIEGHYYSASLSGSLAGRTLLGMGGSGFETESVQSGSIEGSEGRLTRLISRVLCF